jgi:hypothetical protein
MSEKISLKKIILNKKPEVETKQVEQTKQDIAAKIEIKPKTAKKKGLKSHIKKYFTEPLAQLIQDDGVSDGVLIANPEALGVIENILIAILEKRKTSIIEILEAAAFGEVEEYEQVEEVEEDTQDAEECVIEDVEEEEEEESVQEEAEDDEEENFDYDLQEAREFDSYMSSDYLHDDEENMD